MHIVCLTDVTKAGSDDICELVEMLDDATGIEWVVQDDDIFSDCEEYQFWIQEISPDGHALTHERIHAAMDAFKSSKFSSSPYNGRVRICSMDLLKEGA